MTKRTTTEEFIQKAKKIHDNKYDYSCTIYKTVHEKIEYICPKHGKVVQEASSHLRGYGCPYCSYGGKTGNTQSTEYFIKRAKDIHGDFYLYDKVKYLGWYEKVEIECPIHGIFWQEAGNHLLGYGCKKCGQTRTHNSNFKSKEDFVRKAKLKFGDIYDYNLIKYNGCDKPVEIICKKHGVFKMTPTSHLLGHKCPKCVSEEMSNLRRSTTEDFIKAAKKVHRDVYDYSKVQYVERNTPVEIVCKKHGSFFQTPNIHLAGCGCPFCKQTKGENLIECYLKEKGVEYIKEYKIPNATLFSNRKYLFIDFYLPKYNIFIEYNGQQHYFPVSLFGGESVYKMQVERDNSLRQYCSERKIILVEIPYTKKKEIHKILSKLLMK